MRIMIFYPSYVNDFSIFSNINFFCLSRIIRILFIKFTFIHNSLKF